MWTRFGAQERATFDRSFGRSVLVQSNVSAVLIVVSKVLATKPPKMKFVQGDNVLEQFMTHTTVHPVNPDEAENGKVDQVLSSRGSVCVLRISRCFLA